MTNLDALLNELCPNGVPFNKLEECCHLEKGNTPIQKAIPGKYPLVVTTNERRSSNTFQFDQASVCVPLVSSRGHGVACLNQVYYQEGRFALGNILCAVTPLRESGLSAKFLYYYLNLKKDSLIVPLMKGGANVSLTVNSLKKVRVAIPPISVQEEIVQKLQTFEELLDTLSAELKARRKQYEYYRNQLLSFDSHVQWKELEELFDIVDYRGKTPRKTDSGVFLVTAKNIRKGYIDYEASKEYISPDDYEEVMHRGIPRIGDILITTEAPCGNVALVDRDDIALAQRVIKYRPKTDDAIDTTYVKHYLLGKEFQDRLARAATGGTVKGIKGSKLHLMKIPVPPLDVQRRLARALENFDSICNDLNIGIPAEIEARQKQYEYYRDLLLTFAETGSTLATDRQTDRQTEIALLQYVFGYVSLPLGETCDMKAGKAIKVAELSDEEDSEHPYMCYGGNGLRGYIGKANYIGEYPIIGRQGALCGNVQYAEGKFYATEHAVVVTSKGMYKQRYLYYLLTAMNLNQYKSAGAQPGLAVGKLETIPAMVPSLEKQEKAVRILDQFDRLCNDLSSGLPAEIEARQKQYEYYRDKLLTFKEKV